MNEVEFVDGKHQWVNLLTSSLNALIRHRGLHWVLSSFLVCRIMNKPKIVIVGAGPSGIACATKLLDYGFENVMIVEAESRIGGRIHTIPFADNVIDLGAQWCHGEKDNIVYELAHKHNLLQSTGDVYESYQCIRSNREVVSESISQRLKDIVNDSLVTRQMELRNSNGSLGSYLTNKFYEALRRPENSDIDMAIAREFFDNYQKFESSVEASDTLDDVSGHGYLEYWECEGDILLNWKDKGYAEFLRLLMKAHEYNHEFGLLEERILLNHRVTHIDWNRYDSCVQLRCGNGENFLADHVIITVSLGVLKEQHLRTFEPKLPMDKQRAIDGLAFGTVNKIFIEFPKPFWPKKWTGFTMLWREEDIGEIRGTARAWLEDVFGFYCDRNQPRLLSGWIIGANGRHMETLPEDEILGGCMYLFRKFLPWDIPEPCNFKTSTWYTNENFRGSYSFRSMYTEEVGTSARELAQPLYVVTTKPLLNGQSSAEPLFSQSRCDKPVVQFAGEATSDHYFSTVHGAVEAGWREAKRLAELYDMINGARGKISKSHL
uniref:Amine oxidase domain-containing protein n=1 Tax=Glossina pallidipes TaxID=7398 RepID=A0A1A9Z0N5_GLOPL